MNQSGPTATAIPAAQLLHHVQGHDRDQATRLGSLQKGTEWFSADNQQNLTDDYQYHEQAGERERRDRAQSLARVVGHGVGSYRPRPQQRVNRRR